MIFPDTTSTNNANDTGSAGFTHQYFYIHIGPPPPSRPAPKHVCPHRVLGVACDIRPSELTRQYRQIAMKLHPDVGPESEREQRTRGMALLNNAYDIAKKATC